MKRIFIIRHGETDHNRNGYIQGSGIDAPLNTYGRQQADAFYNYYKNVKFDKVYTSELCRTKESVKKFSESGIPTEHHNGLNEISWGSYEGKKVSGSLKKYYLKMVKNWNEGILDCGIEKGESPLDVVERQQDILEKITNNNKEEKILICMHGRAMRILLCQLMGLPLTKMDRFDHHNLGLYLAGFPKNETFKSVNLEKHNCILHLQINGISSLPHVNVNVDSRKS